MKIIPLISITNGCCVRQERIFTQCSQIISHSPAKIAKMWEEQGATQLQLRDAEGMLAGHIVNEDAIKKVMDSVSIPVEVYGGICSVKEVENILNLGARRAILRVNEDGAGYGLLKDAIKYFGTDKISVSFQEKNGASLSYGIKKSGSGEVMNMMRIIVDFGIVNIDYENIVAHDLLLNPNLYDNLKLVKEKGVRVTVSGEIHTIKELELFYNYGAYGIVLGDALYDKRIELKKAIELFDKGDKQDGL